MDLFGRGDVPEQVEKAVRSLHSLGIAHTDATLANIMVTKAGNAKLIKLLSCVPLTPGLQELDEKLLRALGEYRPARLPSGASGGGADSATGRWADEV